MLTKIFPTGQGMGYGPVEYLCSINPFRKGEREKAPQILSGDPALIRRQIDAVPFKHKYTSGVHSFAPEDKPTDEQIMEVIEATEELAFAGLPLSSRSILWAKHEHAERIELHFLIPRQEVNSGKSFNAFPPGWQQKYDPLRDKFNYKYGWARPDDPDRTRHWQPGINAKILADAKRKGKPNPKAEVFSLTDELANMALQGLLSNRSEIVRELRKRGYGINRQGKDYLTIIDKEGKKTRLKGTLFDENFKGPDWIKTEIAKIDKPNSEKIHVDQELAAEADARLQEAIKKTAIYNSNRYAIEEIKNEQSTGRETAFTSEMDTGNVGSCNERHKGKPASFQKSANCERDESHALYSEPGLGENATDRATCGTLRGNAGNSLQEDSIPDSSSSALGRTVGTGSEMAESHRRAAEHIHEWSNPDSRNSFGAGSGDYRWQSERPGRNDGTDHGYTERVARQGFQSGELLQDFRSLKKKARKLEDNLARINQADKKLLDIDLGFGAAYEKMRQIADRVISALGTAYETRLLQNLMHQNISIAPIDTGNLLIPGEEAVEWLCVVNEQRLVQKLAKSAPPLILPNLEGLALHVKMAGNNLALAHETRLLTGPFHETSGLQIPDLAVFYSTSKTAIHALHNANEFRQLQNFFRFPVPLELLALEILEADWDKIGKALKEANDTRLIQKLVQGHAHLQLRGLVSFATMARFTTGRLHSTHEVKILSTVCKRERKRAQIIKGCFFHAEWAGADLERWDKVLAEYRNYPKGLKILNTLIEESRTRFAEILAETGKMKEVHERCGNDPFLLREYETFKKKMDEYEARQAEPEKSRDSVEIGEDKQPQIPAENETPKSEPYLRM